MGRERNPDVERDRTRPEEEGRPPNPVEDISGHGGDGEPVVYGPDGSGETADVGDEEQIGRGAD